jgi:hypothetical protein
LADAADEAEARAVEEQRPRAPQPPPIAQERLKEMALALATPEGARRRPGAGGDDQTAPPAGAPEVPEVPEVSGSGDQPPRVDRGADPAAAASATAGPGEPVAEPGAETPSEVASGPRRLLAINKPGRLVLPKDTAASAARSLSIPRNRGPGRRIASAPPAAASPPAAPEDDRAGPPAGGHDAEGGNGAAGDADADAESRDQAKATRRSRKTQQGLPEGWIIDEEGFVVPGPS